MTNQLLDKTKVDKPIPTELVKVAFHEIGHAFLTDPAISGLALRHVTIKPGSMAKEPTSVTRPMTRSVRRARVSLSSSPLSCASSAEASPRKSPGSPTTAAGRATTRRWSSSSAATTSSPASTPKCSGCQPGSQDRRVDRDGRTERGVQEEGPGRDRCRSGRSSEAPDRELGTSPLSHGSAGEAQQSLG